MGKGKSFGVTHNALVQLDEFVAVSPAHILFRVAVQLVVYSSGSNSDRSGYGSLRKSGANQFGDEVFPVHTVLLAITN